MASSTPMFQLYQDEEHSVGEGGRHAPLKASQPRWAKQSSKKSRIRRLVLSFGALVTIYLMFCAWFTYARGEVYDSYYGPSEEDFPHGKHPWPFPKHPRPHPHPRRRFPRPHPKVLACTAVPTPTSVSPSTSVELDVTFPGHKAVILHDRLIHGDVSVTKVHGYSNVTDHSKGKNLTVSITVANRTCPHHPPTSAVEEYKEHRKFVLCAITFTLPHKHKPHPGEEAVEDVKPGYHHRHRSPPVIVAVLPALNETYPKLPGHHHPPGHPPQDGPDGEDETDTEIENDFFSQPASSVFSRAWRSMVSFLFPMLPVFQESSPQDWLDHFPHHHRRPHPPPPFIVTSLTVTVSKWVRVQYGLAVGRRRH